MSRGGWRADVQDFQLRIDAPLMVGILDEPSLGRTVKNHLRAQVSLDQATFGARYDSTALTAGQSV